MSARTPTRKTTLCPIFATLAEMSQLRLPTNADIIRHYLFVRNEKKGIMAGKDPPASIIATETANTLVNIWKKSSVPTITFKKVTEKVKKLNTDYRTLLKPYKGRQQSESYTKKLTDLKLSWEETLFDIASCKCKDLNDCHCSKEKKIPAQEREFVIDQRTTRNLVIGSIDVASSRKLAKRNQRMMERSQEHEEQFEKRPKLKSRDTASEPGDSENETRTDPGKLSDSDPQPCCSSTSENVTNLQMRVNLTAFARECDRYGVSDRSAASLSSALLQDLGIINEQDTSKIIDRNKVRREREKHRKELQNENMEVVEALYFDGRKDKSLTQTKKGDKYYYSIITEEHISLVKEPGSIYLGHLAVSSGSAVVIKDAILDFFNRKEVSTESLIAVGCDGTNVNTGTNAGIIRLLEIALNRPLQWFICMLHLNELPLRHLLIQLDGVTQGPKAFSGAIGKSIQACETLPLVRFSKIVSNTIPDLDRKILSTDQQYLYDMLHAVSSGECSEDLARIKPGPVVHSRWVTTASRILRLYVASEHPSENLVHLAKFIMKVYGPLWFSIKCKPLCTEGPRHLWRLIAYSRYMPTDLRKIVDGVIQRNGYFGHSENLLLAMLADTREHIRKLACRRIIASRKENKNSTSVRQFRVPPLNMQAEDYTDIIYWYETDRSEPPIIKHVSDEDLESFVSGQETAAPFLDLSKFPCHTQATERCVHLVTEASSKVCGEEKRDGFIKSRIESRKLMKSFNSKSEFKFK